MKINIAKHCGFCTGVNRAINMAEEALKTYGKVAVTGDLVHNKIVMDELKNKGLVFVKSLDEVKDMPLLLRAHGTDKNFVKKAEELGLLIIDATCPLVKEIHKHAIELEKDNRQVIIIGDEKHDEVIGIVSQIKEVCIISKAEDLENCSIKQRSGVVIQSTQRIENVKEIVSCLLTKSRDCRIINTICEPTRRNQKEIRKLAKGNDCVIVVGDKTSANSSRLVEVAKSINGNACLVSSPADLDITWLRNCRSLGISAGASTPKKLIDNVINEIKNIMEI
ncbi:MAG: 4-hydroxy-3-methylbut-2-enyl diphosphate reductase [Candidatus Neomarinimicrobiota bacterium]